MAYPQDIRPITVEIYVDGDWQDISAYVAETASITINRGSGAEDNSTPPTTVTLTLINTDGRFMPENPLSDYYPYLQQSNQIRIRIEDNGTDYTRFVGEVAEWPAEIGAVSQDNYVKVEAGGIFRRWQRSLPLLSPLRRTTLAANTLIAYWPMEDEGGNAQSLASGIAGRPAMDIKQSISVAQYSGFACSKAIPAIGTGQVSGPVAAHAAVGPGQYVFEYLFHTSAVGADDTTVGSIFFAGGSVSRVSVLAHTNGDLRLRFYDYLGAIITTTTYAGTFTVNNADVKIVVSLLNSGSDLIYALSTLVEGDRVTVPSSSGNVSSRNIGTAIYVVFGLFNNLNSHVGHATLFTSQPANYTDVTYSFHSYVEERAGDRLARVCDENGVTYRLIGDPALTPRMGPQPQGTIMDVLRECPEVDHSLMFESRDELGITFLMRDALYNQSTATRIGPDVPVFATASANNQVPVDLSFEPYFRTGDQFQLRLASDDSLVEATVFTITGILTYPTHLVLQITPSAGSTPTTTMIVAILRAGLLALSYTDGELIPPGRPVHDDRLTVNSITVSRDGGSEFLAQQDTGPQSILDPPDGIGMYPDTAALNLYTDGELAEHAYWLLNLGLIDDARWPDLNLGLHTMASRQDDVLSLDIGHRVTVDDLQAVRIYDTQHQLVRGYTEVYQGNRLHYLSLNGVPERQYHVLTFDSSTLDCRWAGKGATLAASLTTTQTGGVKVATGNSLWTTSASDFPQDVMIGGERVTLSGISGAGPTITFVGVGTNASADNASVTPGLPAGAASGDVVFIFASIRGETGSVNTPTNWTSAGAFPNFRIFTRVYDGVWTMPTVTVTGGAAGDTVLAQSAAFRGVELTSLGLPPFSPGGFVYDTSGTAQNIRVSSNVSSIAGQTALRLMFGYKQDDWTSATCPADLTEIGELSSTTGNDASQVWAYAADSSSMHYPTGETVTITGGSTAKTRSICLVWPANPQTFTISARSVNGVVKAHTAGTEVQIADPFYYGL